MLHEDEAWVVRPSGEVMAPDPVRVLDGAVFTLTSPSQVRKPRFLVVAPPPRTPRRTAPRVR